MSSTELAVMSLQEITGYAKHFHASGMFPELNSESKCIVKITAGAEIGIAPFQAMNNLHIISGKITMSALLVGSMIKRSGRYNFRVTKIDAAGCNIKFFEKMEGKWIDIGDSEFTKENAVKAGTKNTDKYPRNMYYARALTNGARWYTPDVFNGAIYTPDELDNSITVDEDDNVIMSKFQPEAVLEHEKPVEDKKEPLPSQGGDLADDNQKRRIIEACEFLKEPIPDMSAMTKDQGRTLWSALVQLKREREAAAKEAEQQEIDEEIGEVGWGEKPVEKEHSEAFAEVNKREAIINFQPEGDPFADEEVIRAQEAERQRVSDLKIQITDELIKVNKTRPKHLQELMPKSDGWTLANYQEYLNGMTASKTVKQNTEQDKVVDGFFGDEEVKI